MVNYATLCRGLCHWTWAANPTGCRFVAGVPVPCNVRRHTATYEPYWADTVSMSMGSSVANLSIAGAVVVLRVNSRSTGHLSLACNKCGESYKYIADLERLGQVTIPPPLLIQQWCGPFHHTSRLILPGDAAESPR